MCTTTNHQTQCSFWCVCLWVCHEFFGLQWEKWFWWKGWSVYIGLFGWCFFRASDLTGKTGVISRYITGVSQWIKMCTYRLDTTGKLFPSRKDMHTYICVCVREWKRGHRWHCAVQWHRAIVSCRWRSVSRGRSKEENGTTLSHVSGF